MFRATIVAILLVAVAAFGPSSRIVNQARVQMNMQNKIAAAVFAGAISFVPMAFAADIEAGALVFAGNCAACHTGGNNVIQNEKTLRKADLEAYLDGGYKPESIVTQVTNGKNAMPAFGGRLDAEEIENVAAYVFDQATKWD
mmetsp:Transcript_28170/g.38737  ORF Transcript_28170/g.38737 Transcript_28170/m.38737 type:complete len:142 (+) Transcript_28170:80-505(+)|eukprot:CAMPEP_0170057980 /NCGR_PEP_ID=MMETSP0019_2-20121128/773_1 /TAXON_ID=98059 /ORGANISM="Dinobryon sp., Strain UTEXLB2267" /LENGTH=141 /DNA_ID=CAMNT_0010262803 /DNA_START=50 /DNA_END=475 /DNA_ORIENTATION=+